MPSIPEDELVWPLFEHLMDAHIKRMNGIRPNANKAMLITVYADKKFSIGELVIELEPFIRQYAAKAEIKLLQEQEDGYIAALKDKDENTKYVFQPIIASVRDAKDRRIKQLKEGQV